MPLLLYDAHCSICSLAALAAAKLTRGYVVPTDIEEGSLRMGLPASLPLDRSWLILEDRAASGLPLLFYILALVPIGALIGRGYAGSYSSMRRGGICRLAPSCGGARGFISRLASFLASSSTRRLRPRA